MTTDDARQEIEHIWEAREITKRSAAALEKQIKSFAGYAPTYMTLQLEQARADIELYSQKLQVLMHSDKAIETVGGDALGVMVTYRLKEIESRSTDGIKAVISLVQENKETTDKALQEVLETVKAIDVRSQTYRESENKHRAERQEENDERMTANEQVINSVLEMIGRLGERLDGVLWLVVGIVAVGAIATVIIVWSISR